MAAPERDLTKESTEAATAFIEAYYTALSASRSTISTFYTAPSTQPDGTVLPSILYNGNALPTGAAVQALFTTDMPTFLHIDAHTLDCHVLNPVFSVAAAAAAPPPPPPARNFSMLVTATGHVRYEDRKAGPVKSFSETFVLVPNLEKGRGPGGRGPSGPRRRDWLIQTQNFRVVVNHRPGAVEADGGMDVE